MASERTPYEIAAADLAEAAINLQHCRDKAAALRHDLSRAEATAANAKCTWESKRDTLLRLIEEQGGAARAPADGGKRD